MDSAEQQWNKGSATKWLRRLLCMCLALGVLSILCTWLGLVGLQAQGMGSCIEMEREAKSYPALGKWDDAPDDLHLNWHVCERAENSSGWAHFENSWYQVFCGWHDFEEANSSCAAQDAFLVSIGSEAENAFVQSLCGWEACWIGLSEKSDTETWLWADGTPVGHKDNWLAYTNWNPGEPNNWRGVDESVAFMNGWFRLDMPDSNVDAGDCARNPYTAPISSGKWHDVAKDARIPYSVCEKPTESICEPGWLSYQGSCYKRICAMHNFWEASDACKKSGSQLASISSAGENKFIRNMCRLHSCRIGLSEPPDSEVWQWADGTSLGEKYQWTGYTNWAESQPDNWGGHDEDCAVMNMHDLTQSMKKRFLFQKITPLFVIWMVAQVCIPVALFVMASLSSRFNSACCAQVVCMVAGVSSIGLCCEIIIWFVAVRKVDDRWPAGSQTLLIFLSIVGFLQVVICCTATSKAQELQWATSIGWSAMGVRNVGNLLQPGSNPSTEMGNPPDP